VIRFAWEVLSALFLFPCLRLSLSSTLISQILSPISLCSQVQAERGIARWLLAGFDTLLAVGHARICKRHRRAYMLLIWSSRLRGTRTGEADAAVLQSFPGVVDGQVTEVSKHPCCRHWLGPCHLPTSSSLNLPFSPTYMLY
jgi:hypothetical protein